MEGEYYRVGRLILGRKPRDVPVPTGSGPLDEMMMGGLRSGWLTVLIEDQDRSFSKLLSPPINWGLFCEFSRVYQDLHFRAGFGRMSEVVGAKTADVVAGRAKSAVGLVDHWPRGWDDLKVLAEIARQLRIPVVAVVPYRSRLDVDGWFNSWYSRMVGHPPGTVVYDQGGLVREWI